MFTVSLPLFLSCFTIKKSDGHGSDKAGFTGHFLFNSEHFFFFFFQAQVHYFLLSAGREVCECDGMRVCVGGGGGGRG